MISSMMTPDATRAYLPPPGVHQRAEIGRELQATLLELIDLTIVGKQLRRSVVGMHFWSLHRQLNHLIDVWHDLADMVAEHAATIGARSHGQADAVMAGKEFVRLERGVITDQAAVRELTGRLIVLTERIRARMERLGELNAASRDVLSEVARTLEQQLWVIRARSPRP